MNFSMGSFEINYSFFLQGKAKIEADSQQEALEIAKKAIWMSDYPCLDELDDRVQKLEDSDWKGEFSEKSPQASLVLRLMDNDFTYSKAVNIALIVYPQTSSKELLEELANYI